MGKSPVDEKTISRIGIAGAILGVLAIALFGVLWVILGEADISVLPRLVTSICVPPAAMAAILGIYLLIRRD
jgi:hypothetical protein